MFWNKKKEKETKQDLFILVGLGNPGAEYERTRHNAGFMVVDAICHAYQGIWKRTKMQADTARVVIEGKKVLLVKPLTYMNNSGEAVRRIQEYYRVESSHLCVIYDDIDVTLGSIRIREKGGSGTHNGMRSIVSQLKTENFPRIRMGIGPKHAQIDIIDFVLGKFSSKEENVFDDSVKKATKAFTLAMKENMQIAMTEYNGS